MPSEALKSLAEKHGVSLSDAERYWDEALDSAKKQGKTGEDKYAYAMGIVKKRMSASLNTEENSMKIQPSKKDLQVLAAGANAQTIDKIIAYESGELDDGEIIDLFAELVKSGMAWQLQGSYGRQAKALIDAGIISRRGEILSYGEEASVKHEASIDKQTEDVIKKLLAKYFGAVKFVKVTPRLSVCAHVPKVISGTIVVRFMQELSSQLEGYEIEGGKFVPKVDNFFIGYSDGKATSQGQFYEVRDTGLNFAVTFDSLNYSISIFSGSMANNLSK